MSSLFNINAPFNTVRFVPIDALLLTYKPPDVCILAVCGPLFETSAVPATFKTPDETVIVPLTSNVDAGCTVAMPTRCSGEKYATDFTLLKESNTLISIELFLTTDEIR